MNILKNELKSDTIGITLVSLVVTIIILLVLAGISIVILGGENGLLSKTKQAKKAHIQSEMQEQLTLALNELQIEKNGSANLEDISQEWINSVISSDYNPTIKEDASLDGKLVVMNKSGISGKFLVNQNLEISKTEYNISSLEFEYETGKLENGKVKILIKVTDKVNGITQIDYPDSNKNPLIMQNRKDPVGIDYSVELGKEYKFVITTGDGIKIEKIIKIDDYYYNITKDFGENAVIDNKATKAAYGKAYEAAISAEGNYVITGLTVTMGEQNITTSENNVVDIDTGKIKIEKVTGDIDIKVTTKKLEIKYTAVAVSTSNSSSNKSSENASSIDKGTPLYINIIANLEGNNCTVVLKSDTTKTVPYPVSTNGKYTFLVSSTYNGKTITEDKEVLVNQYKVQGGFVQYDAGDWTVEEIEELKNSGLYNINKEKIAEYIRSKFGGFTYKGDTVNASDIESGNIITSRNQSVAPQSGYGTPKYSGWQILKGEEKEGKTYVKKIVHAGSPENLTFYHTKDDEDAYITEFILSGGLRQTVYNSIIPRSWQMYIDKKQKDLIADTTDKDGNIIKDIHAMTYNEAYEISSTGGLRNIASYYWLASAYDYARLWYVSSAGYMSHDGNGGYSIYYSCSGIRPVVSLASGVFIKSGDGTEKNPYILGKD